MRIPSWRLALTGGALVVLGIAAVGMVSAADPEVTTPAPGPGLNQGMRPGQGFGPGQDDQNRPVLRDMARNVVHGVLTVNHPEEGLITIQLDHGTVTAVDADSLTISEQGGTTITVSLSSTTKVSEGRSRATIGDIAVGDEVGAVSRVADGATTAQHVHIRPADAPAAAPANGPAGPGA